MSLSLFASLLLLQAAPFAGTVPVRNAELDAAHSCVTLATSAWLKEYDWRPEDDERWRWTLKIVGQCEKEIEATAFSEGSVVILGNYAHSGVSKRNMLRAEANYYVDRLIREQFGEKAK